ncbi:MAG: type II toxin-antitoxin system VapC family toxin [Holophagales bacterium]|nr:MAG: type II toxin-antitoxin system VapC family toxin [Holophagales bacterium]
MRGLDTNVLARFLLRDDAAQFRRAERLVAALATDGEAIHLDVIVLCELAWVLRTGYGRERREIADALDALLGAAPFTVDDREAVRTAIDRYRAGRGDFADYLIALRNQRAGCRDTVTFDRKLRPEDGFTTL